MEKTIKESIFKKPWVQSVAGVLAVIILVVLIFIYKSISSYVKIDEGTISAPIIQVSPETPGILEEVYVQVGDEVEAGQALAQVGAEVMTAKVPGIIVYTNDTPGQYFTYASPVVKMINKDELRLVGSIKEDAGFSKISIGDTVKFTLDAFPGEEYVGIVDEISETSKDSSVVFSISDKREVKEFTIKIKYDVAKYPEFKNGMSAKIKVFTK